MPTIIREFGYDDDGKPVMVLRRREIFSTTKKKHAKAPIKSFCVRLNDAWQFSSEHNPYFDQAMMKTCVFLCDLFSLGLVTPQKMGQLAGQIEDGIEELVRMIPEPKKIIEVGEVRLTATPLSGEGDQETTIRPIRRQVPADPHRRVPAGGKMPVY